MWTIIVRTAIQLAAGLGIADLLDRFVKPKVPANVYPEPAAYGYRFPRLAWLLVAFVVAAFLLKKFGRKIGLKY